MPIEDPAPNTVRIPSVPHLPQWPFKEPIENTGSGSDLSIDELNPLHGMDLGPEHEKFLSANIFNMGSDGTLSEDSVTNTQSHSHSQSQSVSQNRDGSYTPRSDINVSLQYNYAGMPLGLTPRMPLGALKPSERAMLNAARNNGRDEHRMRRLDLRVSQFLQLHRREQPMKLFLSWLDESGLIRERFTYKDFYNACKRVGYRLRNIKNVDIGDRVLLVFQPGLNFYVTFLGCMMCGAVPVPIHPPRVESGPHAPSFSEEMERIKQSAEEVGARVLITDTSLKRKLSVRSFFGKTSLAKNISIHTTDCCCSKTSSCPTLSEDQYTTIQDGISFDSAAFILYTSGSGGTPKGVIITHKMLLDQFQNLTERLSLRTSSVFVSWLPHDQEGCLINVLLVSLRCGCTAHLMSPKTFVDNPIVWMQTLSDLRATNTAAPPFGYDLVTRKTTEEERSRLNLSYVECGVVGGEPMLFDQLQPFLQAFSVAGWRPEALRCAYGLPEYTGGVSVTNRDIPCVVRDPQNNVIGEFPLFEAVQANNWHKTVLRGKHSVFHEYKWPSAKNLAPGSTVAVSSGILLPRHRIFARIIDPETLSPCVDGSEGEIWLRGGPQSKGYWNNEHLSKEVMSCRLKKHDGHEYLRTGDLGFFHDDHLYVVGRLSDRISLEGDRKVNPVAVERAIEKSSEFVRPGCTAVFSVSDSELSTSQVPYLSQACSVLVDSGSEWLSIVTELRPDTIQGIKMGSVLISGVVDSICRAALQESGARVRFLTLIHPRTLPKTHSGKRQRQEARFQMLDGRLQNLYQFDLLQPEESNNWGHMTMAVPGDANRRDGKATVSTRSRLNASFVNRLFYHPLRSQAATTILPLFSDSESVAFLSGQVFHAMYDGMTGSDMPEDELLHVDVADSKLDKDICIGLLKRWVQPLEVDVDTLIGDVSWDRGENVGGLCDEIARKLLRTELFQSLRGARTDRLLAATADLAEESLAYLVELEIRSVVGVSHNEVVGFSLASLGMNALQFVRVRGGLEEKLNSSFYASYFMESTDFEDLASRLLAHLKHNQAMVEDSLDNPSDSDDDGQNQTTTIRPNQRSPGWFYSLFEVIGIGFILLNLVMCTFPALLFVDWAEGTSWTSFSDDAAEPGLFPDDPYLRIFLVAPVAILILSFTLFTSVPLWKKIFIGTYREGAYPLWGFFYFRWWLVHGIHRSAEWIYSPIIGCSPLINFMLRLLGGDVSYLCVVRSACVTECDLLTIEDDALISEETHLRPYTIDMNSCELRLAPIFIGKGVLVGRGCVVQAGSTIHNGATVDDMTVVVSGTNVPPQCVWQGVPGVLVLPGQYSKANHNLGGAFRMGLLICTWLMYIIAVGTAAIPVVALLEDANLTSTPPFNIDTLSAPLTLLVCYLVFQLSLGVCIVIIKWLLVGKVPAKAFARESSYGMRRLIVANLVRGYVTSFLTYFHGSQVVNWFYQLLGCSIASSAVIPALLTDRDFDLITIEQNAVVGDETFLYTSYEYGRNVVQLTSMAIENDVTIESKTLIKAPRVGAGSRIISSTLSTDGESIPPISIKSGAPATVHQMKRSLSYEDSTMALSTLVESRSTGTFPKVMLQSLYLLVLLCIVGGAAIASYVVFTLAMDSGRFILVVLAAAFAIKVVLLSLMIVEGVTSALLRCSVAEENKSIIRIVSMPGFVLWMNFHVGHVNRTNMRRCGIVGTVWYNVYLRLLGARIGKGCLILTTAMSELHTIGIGQGSVLDEEVSLSPKSVNSHLNIVQFAPIIIGSRCYLAPLASIPGGVVVGDEATLEPLCQPLPGEVVPPSSVWTGNPAYSRAPAKESKRYRFLHRESKPLSQLVVTERVKTLIMDLDVFPLPTTSFTMPESVVLAIHRAAEAGMRTILLTSRPSGWAQSLVSALPVAAVIAESGGVVLFKYKEHHPIQQWFTEPDRRKRVENQRALQSFVNKIQTFVPQKIRRLKSSVLGETDVALQKVTVETFQFIAGQAQEEGFHASIASDHVNIWKGDYDKLKSLLRVARILWDMDALDLQRSSIFVGDVMHDLPILAFFPRSVALPSEDLKKLRVELTLGRRMPAFIAKKNGSEGLLHVVETVFQGVSRPKSEAFPEADERRRRGRSGSHIGGNAHRSPPKNVNAENNKRAQHRSKAQMMESSQSSGGGLINPSSNDEGDIDWGRMLEAQLQGGAKSDEIILTVAPEEAPLNLHKEQEREEVEMYERPLIDSKVKSSSKASILAEDSEKKRNGSVDAHGRSASRNRSGSTDRSRSRGKRGSQNSVKTDPKRSSVSSNSAPGVKNKRGSVTPRGAGHRGSKKAPPEFLKNDVEKLEKKTGGKGAPNNSARQKKGRSGSRGPPRTKVAARVPVPASDSTNITNIEPSPMPSPMVSARKGSKQHHRDSHLQKREAPTIEFTVVIPHFSDSKVLKKTVAAVFGAQKWTRRDLKDRSFAVEIVIVDSNNLKEERELEMIYKRCFPRMPIKFVPAVDLPSTNSFSTARNVAISHASAEWIVFIDAASMLAPHYFTELKLFLRDMHAQHGANESFALTGRRVFVDSSKLKAKRIVKDSRVIKKLPVVEGSSNSMLIEDRRLPELEELANLDHPWAMFDGPNVVVRRMDIEEVGGFDNRFDGVFGYEEMDLVYRLVQRIGSLALFVPGCEVFCQENEVRDYTINLSNSNFQILCEAIPSFRAVHEARINEWDKSEGTQTTNTTQTSGTGTGTGTDSVVRHVPQIESDSEDEYGSDDGSVGMEDE